jgi:hypothetical protein
MARKEQEEAEMEKKLKEIDVAIDVKLGEYSALMQKLNDKLDECRRIEEESTVDESTTQHVDDTHAEEELEERMKEAYELAGACGGKVAETKELQIKLETLMKTVRQYFLPN